MLKRQGNNIYRELEKLEQESYIYQSCFYSKATENILKYELQEYYHPYELLNKSKLIH